MKHFPPPRLTEDQLKAMEYARKARELRRQARYHLRVFSDRWSHRFLMHQAIFEWSLAKHFIRRVRSV